MKKKTNGEEGMSYAETASNSGTVKSFRGSDGIFHVTTPLIESSGLDKLCIQTSLRTIKNSGSILERLTQKLKHQNINLAEDTFSVDLTPNRLVLCMKSQLQAEALLQKPIWLSEREQLQFCVNEPRIWVMTIFKVPGFYDQNNYLKSFAARFGVVYRIYRKTFYTQSGKAFGGPNVIVQYTTLFELPPTRLVLDGRYSLSVFWTMPGPDMVHPDKREEFRKQIQASKGPHTWISRPKPPATDREKPNAAAKDRGTNPSKSVIPRGEIVAQSVIAREIAAKSAIPREIAAKSVIPGEIAAKSVIPQGEIVATKKKVNNKTHGLMNNRGYKIQKVARDKEVDFKIKQDPFFIVGKKGKHKCTKMKIAPATPPHKEAPEANLPPIDDLMEGEISPGFVTDSVHESEGEDVIPEDTFEKDPWDALPPGGSQQRKSGARKGRGFSREPSDRRLRVPSSNAWHRGGSSSHGVARKAGVPHRGILLTIPTGGDIEKGREPNRTVHKQRR